MRGGAYFNNSVSNTAVCTVACLINDGRRPQQIGRVGLKYCVLCTPILLCTFRFVTMSPLLRLATPLQLIASAIRDA